MDFNQMNKRHWDKASLVHLNAPRGYYDIEGFNRGGLSLKPVHIKELGDLKGKKILHLLCHIGLDSLSLARLGASVVGVDISENAVDIAKELSEKNKLDARFICTDVYGLKDVLEEDFDIVFASHGVTCWLKDLDEFMSMAYSYLKPGGFFYLMDGHPVSMIMSNEPDGEDIRVAGTYFKENTEPSFYEGSEDYADKEVIIDAPTYEWHYTVSDILNSVGQSGLRLTSFNEHPFCDDTYYVGMKKDSDGWYRLNNESKLPLMYSLKAIK
ncbi:class I SAM-dependent methyltransferase [Acidaminobacter sp. JC074]|uniref:class I SAM-dependent methyltransferase n=1 Tax=Acidaminobacter sp. JC074 TaxID=2530199 RepID=UPI001F0F7477|nr:class I SAM-dependent methyltransferase [Acidaminobacter sp. JC074]MCH4887859.1 class I SAM-dependent methyltransferase [Acidaminobacter sp. JC074]